MIHFILFILKWIGWILLAVLGILLLLLCIVLFVPLRYEASGACKDDIQTLRGRVKLSFLLHLISGNLQYEDGHLRWDFKVAWKHWKCEEEQSETKKTIEPDETPKTKTAEFEQKSVEENGLKKQESNSTPVEYDPTLEKKNLEKLEPESKKSKQTKKKKKSFSKRLEEWFANWKNKYDEISVKIKSLLRKKELIMKFLESEIHQAAFLKVLRVLKKMLFKLKPKRLSGSVEFGFEDPYLTGKVLTWASILYPYYADSLEVIPNFEEQVFDGSLEVQGKIALHTFVFAALKIALDKKVRLTIRHIKKLKTML